jgi:hypothetical protein
MSSLCQMLPNFYIFGHLKKSLIERGEVPGPSYETDKGALDHTRLGSLVQ